jgi:hypothetical protein
VTTILKPGILVSLKTTIKGGVHYERRDLSVSLDDASVAQAGPEDEPSKTDVAKWETTRVIDDRDEHERAVKLRSKARALITTVCVTSDFGLLCPQAREAELDQALAEARRIADEHNLTSKATIVRVYVMKGRIASTDEEATRAIASEITDLLEDMQRGIREADPKMIREAANRAREVGQVLDVERQEKVQKAVDVARAAARAIVKRVEKNGEDAQMVIQQLVQAPIETARFAFLDFETAKTEGTSEAESEQPLPATNLQRFAELEV